MAINKVLSQEDGNLNAATINVARNKKYKDIDLTFSPKPNGEIYTKLDAAAVKQAIKNLLLTNYFERPFQPYFGADIASLLFELNNDDLELEVFNKIKNAIEAYEPRALVLDIRPIITPDSNTLKVTVEFQVISTSEIVSFTTSISRLR